MQAKQRIKQELARSGLGTSALESPRLRSESPRAALHRSLSPRLDPRRGGDVVTLQGGSSTKSTPRPTISEMILRGDGRCVQSASCSSPSRASNTRKCYPCMCLDYCVLSPPPPTHTDAPCLLVPCPHLGGALFLPGYDEFCCFRQAGLDEEDPWADVPMASAGPGVQLPLLSRMATVSSSASPYDPRSMVRPLSQDALLAKNAKWFF